MTACEDGQPVGAPDVTVARSYDPDGLLATVVVSDTDSLIETYELVWDRSTPVAELLEIDGPNGTTELIRGVGLEAGVTAGSSVTFGRDPLGDITSGPTSIDGFGPYAESANDVTVGVGYRGELAIAGTIYLRNRSLDTGTGRFMTMDGLAPVWGTAATSTYQYAFDNPIGLSDPSGLRPGELVFGGGSGRGVRVMGKSQLPGGKALGILCWKGYGFGCDRVDEAALDAVIDNGLDTLAELREVEALQSVCESAPARHRTRRAGGRGGVTSATIWADVCFFEGLMTLANKENATIEAPRWDQVDGRGVHQVRSNLNIPGADGTLLVTAGNVVGMADTMNDLVNASITIKVCWDFDKHTGTDCADRAIDDFANAASVFKTLTWVESWVFGELKGILNYGINNGIIPATCALVNNEDNPEQCVPGD